MCSVLCVVCLCVVCVVCLCVLCVACCVCIVCICVLWVLCVMCVLCVCVLHTHNTYTYNTYELAHLAHELACQLGTLISKDRHGKLIQLKICQSSSITAFAITDRSGTASDHVVAKHNVVSTYLTPPLHFGKGPTIFC